MPTTGGPHGRDDVLCIIERRIVENAVRLLECMDRRDNANVEYLRGCISELEIVRRAVEALPISLPAK